jgi:hypothetical protein
MKYKNPAGYVFGYISTNGGTSYDPERIKAVIQIIPSAIAQEFGITDPDVVRYARLWHKHIGIA